MKELDKLSASEVEIMMKAPLLVCVLIAGADNEIDNKEIKGAIELAEEAQAKVDLSEFYKMVTEDFEDKLKIILQGLPIESTQRNPILFEELNLLNAVFPKLKKSFAQEYYKSLRFLAKKVAESSGGVLGIKSVGEEEMKFLKLPMIKDPSAL